MSSSLQEAACGTQSHEIPLSAFASGPRRSWYACTLGCSPQAPRTIGKLGPPARPVIPRLFRFVQLCRIELAMPRGSLNQHGARTGAGSAQRFHHARTEFVIAGGLNAEHGFRRFLSLVRRDAPVFIFWKQSCVEYSFSKGSSLRCVGHPTLPHLDLRHHHVGCPYCIDAGSESVSARTWPSGHISAEPVRLTHATGRGTRTEANRQNTRNVRSLRREKSISTHRSTAMNKPLRLTLGSELRELAGANANIGPQRQIFQSHRAYDNRKSSPDWASS